MDNESSALIPSPLSPGPAAWQRKWYKVIFEHDTPAGKAFDVVLLVVIMLSILTVMLESVEPLHDRYDTAFFVIEWVITLLFTIEFLARVAVVSRSWKYTFSFFGLVDLVSLLPTYLGLFFTGAQSLAVIRTLRLLRVFRVLKLARHVSEARTLLAALRQTWPKITVFLLVMLCAILISGTVMYLVEHNGENSKFNNIPISVYWAIVTVTTVGYGDIAPSTDLGRFIAAVMMLFGYAVIIVPTGIFSAEIVITHRSRGRHCKNCGEGGLSIEANYCENCGVQL